MMSREMKFFNVRGPEPRLSGVAFWKLSGVIGRTPLLPDWLACCAGDDVQLVPGNPSNFSGSPNCHSLSSTVGCSGWWFDRSWIQRSQDLQMPLLSLYYM